MLTSDASSRWGCGAFWNTLWFQFEWSEALSRLHITNKELIPIALAAASWGANGKTCQSCLAAIILLQFTLLTQVLVLTLMQWLLFVAYTLLLLGLILHCQLFTYLAPRMPWLTLCLAIIFHIFFSINHRPADIHPQSLLQLSAS